MVLGGPHLHLKDDAQVVDQGGQDGGLDDDRVLYAQGLRHDKGGGAHDGGQQLSAHRGGGLHGPGKLLGVARLLHQGDGKGAGGDHIGHGGAVDGAQEAGGQHRHLGGAALGVAGQGVGNVIEELAHAALVHHLAEDDEQHDKGGRHLHGASVDAGDIAGEVLDHPGPGVAPVLEDAGEVPAVHAIDQEDGRQDGEGRAADAPGALHYQQDEQGAHDDVQRGGPEAGGGPGHVAVEHIAGHGHRQRNADPVIPGHLFPAGLLKSRVKQEAQHQHHAHVDGVVLDVLGGHHARGKNQVVYGKEQAQNIARLHQGLEGKVTGAGLLFKLFHNLRALGRVDGRGFGSFDGEVAFGISHGRNAPFSQ